MTKDFINKTVTAWLQEAKESGNLDLNPSPHCRVCQDPAIMGLVNKMLAMGFSIPAILDTLEANNLKRKRDNEPQISRDSLYNHRKSHFDIQAPAAAQYRKIQEKRYGEDLGEGVANILNAMSYHETLMIRGYETVIDPETIISPELGAKSADKLYEMMRKDSGEFEMAEMRAEVGRIVEVVRRFIPAEQWPVVQAALRGEEPVRQPTKSVEGSVRMVDIDDTPDKGE